jgi:hypothetical protein
MRAGARGHRVGAPNGSAAPDQPPAAAEGLSRRRGRPPGRQTSKPTDEERRERAAEYARAARARRKAAKEVETTEVAPTNGADPEPANGACGWCAGPVEPGRDFCSAACRRDQAAHDEAEREAALELPEV